VQAHGGQLALVAQPTGTCFSVSLPVEAGHQAGYQAEQHVATTSAEE